MTMQLHRYSDRRCIGMGILAKIVCQDAADMLGELTQHVCVHVPVVIAKPSNQVFKAFHREDGSMSRANGRLATGALESASFCLIRCIRQTPTARI